MARAADTESAHAPVERRRFRWGGLVLGLGLVGVFGGFALWLAAAIWAPGPLAADRTVVIPRGAAPTTIAGRMAEAGVVADGRVFLLVSLATTAQGPMRAGEFAFPAGVSMQGALDILRNARPVQRRVTIPEGLTTAQILALLDRTEGLSGDVGEIPAEGSLLPETWSFEWGDSRRALVARMGEAMNRALAETWARRDASVPLANPREALILASIIEKETAVASERARVAGVFANRLRRGMPLQTDPTVVYAVTRGQGVLDRPISRADLEIDSPYNTYRVRGLPPSPIASPGRASLLAAVQPEQHDFLYFVADGTGGHAFGRTLEEHNRNVARWRAIEAQR